MVWSRVEESYAVVGEEVPVKAAVTQPVIVVGPWIKVLRGGSTFGTQKDIKNEVINICLKDQSVLILMI